MRKNEIKLGAVIEFALRNLSSEKKKLFRLFPQHNPSTRQKKMK